MSIIYLQCDVRYNQWLLEKIGDKYVVEHTMDKCRRLQAEKIVAGIYTCADNLQLMEILKKNGVIVKDTKEENVNQRFLDIVLEEETDYVIRVSGDQCLMDTDLAKDIEKNMKKEALEWFFERYASCILPDIISIKCLKKWKKEIEKGTRYFKILENIPDIKKYYLPYPILLLYNFRANSNEGFRVCKNIIMNHLNVYDLSLKLLPRITNSKYLVKTGILGSWIIPAGTRDFYYDEEKEINPWLAKSVSDFIKKHLNQTLKVFEWGGGNSTLFWSRYVKEVVTVEHDKRWYQRMLETIPDNVCMKYCELEYGKEYCHMILKEEKDFDIILIDGRDRVNCAKNAVTKLTKQGIILWDDSEREVYREGFEFLQEKGFKQIELSSIGYGSPGAEQVTSIFYRTGNFCGI